MVFLHQIGLKMDQKELIVYLKGLAVHCLDQNIPDFWFKKKWQNFFWQNKSGGVGVYQPPPFTEKLRQVLFKCLPILHQLLS